MTAAHRELVYYLIEALEKQKVARKDVLVIGKDAEVIASLLPKEFSAQGCTDLSTFTQQVQEAKYDAIIVNGVFGDLPPEKVEDILKTVLKVIRIGAYVIIRQYLGNSKSNLAQYTSFFDSYRLNAPAGKISIGFRLLWEQGLRDTTLSRHDWQDHCWLLMKSEFEPVDVSKTAISFRDYLDRHQYTDHGIKKYEWIFGHGFISPGGEAQNGEFIAQLNLKPSDTVLDIGCGIGGNAFQIARDYGAQVVGVDLSSNVITVACEQASLKKDCRVRFLIADITAHDFPPGSFDVVYSRDCILHIPNKHSLFEKIYTWLKPGGRLLITDYMRSGQDKQAGRFQRYVADRQYTLWPLNQYVQSAEKSGFPVVEGKDITQQFKRIIETEIARAKENEKEFLQQFSQEEYDHLIEGWQNKLGYIADGDLKWGLIKAEK